MAYGGGGGARGQVRGCKTWRMGGMNQDEEPEDRWVGCKKKKRGGWG